VRWETKQSCDGQLYQEYSYQNLLKLDHVSSSYDEQNFGVFFMPHSVVYGGATENARLENPAPTRRGGKRRNKLYGQPMGQFSQFIEITVSLIL